MMSEFKAQISNVNPTYSTGTRKKKEDGQEAPLLFGHHIVSEHSTTFSETESLAQAASELNISEINSRKIRKISILPGACQEVRTEASGSEASSSNNELGLVSSTEVKNADQRSDQPSPKTLNEQRRLFINNWFGPADITLDSLFGTHIGNGNGFVIFKSSPDSNHYAVLITRFDDYLETFDAMPVIFVKSDSNRQNVRSTMYLYGEQIDPKAKDIICFVLDLGEMLHHKSLTPLKSSVGGLPRDIIDSYRRTSIMEKYDDYKSGIFQACDNSSSQELEAVLNNWIKNSSEDDKLAPNEAIRTVSRRHPTGIGGKTGWMEHFFNKAVDEKEQADFILDKVQEVISETDFLSDELKTDFTKSIKNIFDQARVSSSLSYARDRMFCSRARRVKYDRYYYLSMAALIAGPRADYRISSDV